MSDPMARFYKTNAKIFTAGTDGSYDGDTKMIPDGEIKCDFQPMDGGLETLERGHKIKSRAKVYCPRDERMAPGRYLEINGAYFFITDVERWNMGLEITVEERQRI